MRVFTKARLAALGCKKQDFYPIHWLVHVPRADSVSRRSSATFVLPHVTVLEGPKAAGRLVMLAGSTGQDETGQVVGQMRRVCVTVAQTQTT